MRLMLGHDCRNDIWSRVQVWSLASLHSFKTGSITRGSSNRSTEDDVGLTRASPEGCPQSQWAIYEGDSNVSNDIRYFACNVGARLFCVPRCRRADSPSVDIRGDFFSRAPLQASQLGLKAAPTSGLRLFRNQGFAAWTYLWRRKEPGEIANHEPNHFQSGQKRYQCYLSARSLF